jgi:hypothetical protein
MKHMIWLHASAQSDAQNPSLEPLWTLSDAGAIGLMHVLFTGSDAFFYDEQWDRLV